MKGRVLVVGLGLIGGSLALCIKKEYPEATIVGFDRNEQQCQLGKMLGVIDEIAYDMNAEASRANLIILATPVREIERLIERLSQLPLLDDVLITDVGSTKVEIVKRASSLRMKGVTFIGGHPMAGSHKTGVTAAKDILFENAFYLLTPESKEEQQGAEKLKEWLKGTRAKFLQVMPEEHDYLTGVISHFPHVIAASLVHQAEKTSQTQNLVTRLAAGGFRDITRIASSSPEMWKDISIHNKHVLLTLLEEWQKEMKQISKMLKDENEEEIYRYFYEAKKYRDEMPVKEKGAIPAFYDLFVDIPDYPGVISEVTGYLAQEEISITNIRVREAREGIYGILVISFQTEEDRERAEKCLQKYTSFDTSIGL